MNKLEEILYLADLLEESRDFEGVSQLRKVLKEKGPERDDDLCAGAGAGVFAGAREHDSPRITRGGI